MLRPGLYLAKLGEVWGIAAVLEADEFLQDVNEAVDGCVRPDLCRTHVIVVVMQLY